jgi:hypothetical protein
VNHETTPASDPGAIRFSQLLGFRDGDDAAHWARIRSTQLDAGRQLALLLLCANLVGAATTVSLFATQVSAWWLGGWAMLVAAVARRSACVA